MGSDLELSPFTPGRPFADFVLSHCTFGASSGRWRTQALTKDFEMKEPYE
jgi:hypothetical protein